MIDFSKVQSIAIPEGIVESISCGATILWRKLPEFADEYQRVEWIGVSGTQWINTGITPQSDNVVYECEWVETSQERSACLFAATLVNYDSTKGNRFTGNIYHPGYGNLSISVARSGDTCKYSGIVAGEKNTLTVTILNGTLTRVVNGDTATSAYTGTIVNGVNIGLFATNRDTTVHEYCKYTRMYSWKMWDGGVLVRDMIPCYRKADGVIGMYDTVSKRFFTNAGSGEFTKGADVMVDDYTPAILGKAILGKTILGKQ